MNAFLVIWYVIFIVQNTLGYGTAYRMTKNGGNNGVALCGWLFITNLASFIPGLGFYLWYCYRYADDLYSPSHTNTALTAIKPLYSNASGWTCKECGSKNVINQTYCGVCGKYY